MEMFNPPHPGEIIREDCLKPLGLTVTEAADGLGVTRKALSDVLNGHSAVSPEMAIRLEKAGWPAYPLDLRPVRHRKADRGRGRAVPVTGGAVGRHRHQQRALDDCLLGGLADVERDLIRTRTAEGRSRAKARGQHMGRPPKLTPQQQKEARRRRAQGATLKELAKSYNVGRATISRLAS